LLSAVADVYTKCMACFQQDISDVK